MARWRPRRTVKLHAVSHEGTRLPHASWRGGFDQERSRPLEDRWKTLHSHCADPSSHLRLGRLLHRLAHDDPGVQESALAELELAAHLSRAGARIRFLPESQARTADLECYLGRERFFVEVTAMVGAGERRRLPLRGMQVDQEPGDEEDRGVILIHRILARIQQKAKQLADYCDPVILHVSIPCADLKSGRTGRHDEIWLDLKTLAGSVTVALTRHRHLSAVLISLWDVHPLPSKAATRLANVEVVERSMQQRTAPRVRMLIQNPAAAAVLSEGQTKAFYELL